MITTEGGAAVGLTGGEDCPGPMTMIAGCVGITTTCGAAATAVGGRTMGVSVIVADGTSAGVAEGIYVGVADGTLVGVKVGTSVGVGGIRVAVGGTSVFVGASVGGMGLAAAATVVGANTVDTAFELLPSAI